MYIFIKLILTIFSVFLYSIKLLFFSHKKRFSYFKDIRKKIDENKYKFPGVYLIIHGSKVIYIGETKSIIERLGNSHYSGGKGAGSDLVDKLYPELLKSIDRKKRINELYDLGLSVKILFVKKGERFRKLLEFFLITILNPKYNK